MNAYTATLAAIGLTSYAIGYTHGAAAMIRRIQSAYTVTKRDDR